MKSDEALIKKIEKMSILSIEKAKKRVMFELKNKRQFCVVGGMDFRERKPGIAHFTPREMIDILESGVSEDAFIDLITLKESISNAVFESVNVTTEKEDLTFCPTVDYKSKKLWEKEGMLQL